MLNMMIGGTLTPRSRQDFLVFAAAACQRTVRRNLQAWRGLPRLTNTPRQKNATTEPSTVFTLAPLFAIIWADLALMISRLGATISG